MKAKRWNKVLLTGWLALIPVVPQALLAVPQVLINEFMAANAASSLDPDFYQFSDWIELYNAGDQPVDLQGFTLTDNLNRPAKWRFPFGILLPGEYLVVWADGADWPPPDARPPSTTDALVFADGLEPAWQVSANSRTHVDLHEENVVYRGRQAMAVETTLFTLRLTTEASLDWEKYGSLIFAFHPGEATAGFGTGSFTLFLNDNGVDAVSLLGEKADEATVDMTRKEWQEIEIPLERFNPQEPIWKLTLGGTLEGKFYLDEIRLTRKVYHYHTNFSLSKSGEAIGLFDPTGRQVDVVVFGPQVADVSQGRLPSETQEWRFFAEPTPGGPNVTAGIADPVPCADPEFSLPGGFYRGRQTLVLRSPEPSAAIHCTRDGAIPTRADERCDGEPLALDSTGVIRARAFADHCLPSATITHTYLIDEPFTLPVVAIATDPPNLWDDMIGIYVDGKNGIISDDSVVPKNSYQPWERPGHIEFYEIDGRLGFAQDFALSIHGGFTRQFPQKSLSVMAKNKYGAERIHYPLFAKRQVDAYRGFMLRNGGNDWLTNMLDDELMQYLLEDRMDVDFQDYQPVIVFLNGQYWGLHNAREKCNRYYPETKFGLDPDRIDIVEGDGLVKAGDAEHYRAMVRFLETADLSIPETYAHVETLMDVEQFMNLQIALIYSGPVDNFFKNVKYWRPQNPEGRWRWFLYDTDNGWSNFKANTLLTATDPDAEYPRFGDISWGTLMLRKLLENPGFREAFIQRFAIHLNTTFAPERALAAIDQLQAGIEAEMPRHITRWKDECTEHVWWGTFCGIPSMASWHRELDRLRQFVSQRPAHVRQHLAEYFGLSEMVELQIEFNPDQGQVLLEGTPAPTNCLLFAGIPLQLQAAPRPGYRFAGWEGNGLGETSMVDLVLHESTTLTAHFAPAPQTPATEVYINEFVALNSSLYADEYGEYDDWIELYNAADQAVDVGGFYLTDRLDRPTRWQIPTTRPDLTTIPPGGFLLVWADGDTLQGVLHANFRLSGDGEQVGLVQIVDADTVFIDSLTFGPQQTDVAYGRYPDGTPGFHFLTRATPGAANHLATPVTLDNAAALPERFVLHPNYPNPFNAGTVLSFELPEATQVRLQVYTITGQWVTTLAEDLYPAGRHQVIWKTTEGLASGLYFCRLQAGSFTATGRMLLLK